MITVITPTLGRARFVVRLSETIASHAPGFNHVAQFETEPRPHPEVVNCMIRSAFENPEVRAVVYLADYCEVQPDFGKRMLESFADSTDHMQGIIIDNMEPVENLREFCYWAVGREFYERFKGGCVMCPEYWHFSADTELGLAAKAMGKFKLDDGIRVKINHPNAGNAQWDETHNASRKYRNYDKDTRAKRAERGLLWGVSFDLVNDSLPWGGVRDTTTEKEMTDVYQANEYSDNQPATAESAEVSETASGESPAGADIGATEGSRTAAKAGKRSGNRKH